MLHWLPPAHRMIVAPLSSFPPVLSALQRSPVLVLFLVGKQDGLFSLEITQPNSGGAGLRSVKHFALLRYRLCWLRWCRLRPYRVRANGGLPFGFKQLLF